MPTWRCPHCQTPQPESSRCWVCKRSSTSCGTCRHFRRSIAGQFGFCALDRQRLPLVGDEIRGCWQDADRPAASTPLMPRDTERAPKLDFIPVGEAIAPMAAPPNAPVATPPNPTARLAATPIFASPDVRSSLWDD